MKFSNFFDVEDDFNYQSEKKKFINNMDKLKSMSVEEQTLYRNGRSLIKMKTSTDLLISLICLKLNYGNKLI